MPDDLDDLLRATMKTLDDQVPSGYFEALPERVSARLAAGGDIKEVEMQHTSSSSSGPAKTSTPAAPLGDVSTGVPPVSAKREEDSGLHDIRNLAQSTKQRISVKRIATNPGASRDDEDILASSSASWKNLALPQPAKMVSLPAIDELPSKQDIAAQDKAARAAAKQAAKEAKLEAKLDAAAPADAAAMTSTASGATSAPVEYKPAFSAFAARAPKKSNTGRNLALVGMGLAAAAGIVIFVTTQNNSAKSEAPVAAERAKASDHSLEEGKAKLDEATAKLQAQHAAAEKQEADTAAAGAAAPAPAVEPAPPPVDDKADATKDAATRGVTTKGAAHHAAPAKAKSSEKPVKEEVKSEPKTPDAAKKVSKGEPGDPNFDDLLKEAGVQDKKADKPKLEKKDLTGEDFKKGMGAVQAKAAACFKGTQGTADVKLTIAPSGQVSKVTVGGVFKGKPEADCVAAAVKGASFPAWDGAPKSFGYPILLSE